MLSKGNKMFVLRAFIYLYYFFRNDEKWRSNWIMMHNILLSSHLLKKEPIYYKSFAAVMIPHWFIVHNHDSMKENYAVCRHENLQLCLNLFRPVPFISLTLCEYLPKIAREQWTRKSSLNAHKASFIAS